VYEALKYYNHCEGDGTTVDLRSSFQLDNLRIEIVQNEYIADPWASTYLKPRIHTITRLHPTTAAFAGCLVSSLRTAGIFERYTSGFKFFAMIVGWLVRQC